MTDKSIQWKRTRLKYLGRLKAGAGFPDAEQGMLGEALPFFKVKHLSEANADYCLEVSEHTVSHKTAAQLGAFVFPVDTIVFAKVGAALLLNRFRFLNQDSCIDNNMMGFMLDTTLADKRFLLNRLSLLDFAQVANPGAVPSLNAEQVAEQEILIPTLPHQRKIADFLDQETAKIDALIAAKERLLGILSEKRRALITHAVTRGLNPGTLFSDSGIPWLGKIPAHWDTHRLAWLFKDRDERNKPELPLLEVSINAGVVLREFSDDRIESTAANFNIYKVARKGDVVFNKMRMWQGAVGVAPEDGLVSPDYTVAASIGDLSPEYAELLFRTDMFSAECARNSHGIVWDRMRLYWTGFRDIVVPVPPAKEQQAIVGYIKKETARLDALREATVRTIGLSKERRAALIAAAVTGSIDVSREVA
jgi:restriction endonuclease S subunit